MRKQKIIISAIDEPLQTPSSAELTEPVTRWKSFNAVMWRLFVGFMTDLNQPHVWTDHSVELDDILSRMGIEDTYGANDEWVKVFDFRAGTSGFTTIGGAGTWTLNSGWVSVATATQHVVEIERPLVAEFVAGAYLLTIISGSGTPRQALLETTGEETIQIINEPALPNVTTHELQEYVDTVNTTHIRIKTNKPLAGNVNSNIVRQAVVWGYGEPPI